MISVSNDWKALQGQTLLPEMFVEITYGATEPWLHEEAMVSATEPEEYSDLEQLVRSVDKDSESHSTLDYGSWGLDGNYSHFEGTPVDPGYVYSEHSDADGMFIVQPEITIDFEKRHTVVLPGIQITWDKAFGSWATDFQIIVSNSNGVVDDKTIRGNTSIVTQLEFDIVDYSQIKIRVLKWSHPYQRVRCVDIMLGASMVYTKNDLLGFSHRQSVDLLSAALPENTVTFKLRNDDGRWNPDSPTGTEKYLAEQQPIIVRYGMDVNGAVEWIPGGMFWLSEWNTPSNGMEADFTAKSAISFMANIYKGTRVGTLYDIAVAALNDVSVLASRYVVSESLKDLTTDFSEDTTTYTIAEVLQMIAHAGNCVLYQDRDGVVHIESWKQVYSDYTIGPDISYSHPEYTMNKPLKAISVEYGSDRETVELEYAPSGEVQTVSNPFIRTRDDAERVGKKALEILQNRKIVSGEYRADLRMDVLDNILVTSKYATNVIGVTEVEYSTSGGAFRGKYTGRVVSVKLNPINVYSNEFYSNEIW